MQQIDKQAIVIRFAGDSGDGIQSIGKQMADTAIRYGNYIYTITDYPAEIRAPIGTLRGISRFQLCFSTEEIQTAGDSLDTLVAFNPAALKDSLADLNLGGVLIVDLNKFAEYDLKKAQYAENPLLTGELNNYRIITIPLSSLTQNAVSSFNLTRSQALKCKNMFALGIVYYLYDRPLEHTLAWIKAKFKGETIVAANLAACKAGYDYSANTELFSAQYIVASNSQNLAAKLRYITGNQALVLGCLHIAEQAPYGLFASGYPITPASEILQELTKYPDLNVVTLQAEDEIAAMSACLGAAFGGAIAITCTSGPGFDLKQEAIGLAVMAELPVIIIDVQRAGPSTGMPTKSEQTDLFAAMYGRHGESPVAILAPSSPKDCFTIMLEAAQIAVKYMTPVIVLSDGVLANVAETWSAPMFGQLPRLAINYCQEVADFKPYKRDSKTLARPWVVPGTAHLTHRIGGLEKQNISGDISYDPENHQHMVKIRALKIARIADDIAATQVNGDPAAQLLLISWGSTLGVVTAAVNQLATEGVTVAHIHLRNLHPLPADLGAILHKYKRWVCIEANLGQLSQILRAKFLIDIQLISKVTGQQFLIKELTAAVMKHTEQTAERTNCDQ